MHLAVWADSPNCASGERVFLQRAKVPRSANAPISARRLYFFFHYVILIAEGRKHQGAPLLNGRIIRP